MNSPLNVSCFHPDPKFVGCRSIRRINRKRVFSLFSIFSLIHLSRANGCSDILFCDSILPLLFWQKRYSGTRDGVNLFCAATTRLPARPKTSKIKLTDCYLPLNCDDCLSTTLVVSDIVFKSYGLFAFRASISSSKQLKANAPISSPG